MKRKLNIDRPPITSDEIAKMQNFEGVMSQFTAGNPTPLIKNPWFITTLAGLTLTIAIVIFNSTNQPEVMANNSSENESTHDETFAYAEDTPCINPPVKTVDVPFENYEIDVKEGGIITHPSGSKIIIPKDGLVNQSGEPVTGICNIKYREIMNPVDIFFSGIKMSYDSAGSNYDFESGGMIQIFGDQNGEPVFISDKSPIKIELRSKSTTENYNVYSLDTVAKNWTYKERNSGNPLIKEEALVSDDSKILSVPQQQLRRSEEKVIQTEKKLHTVQSEIKEIQTQKPVKESKNKDRQFTLDINPKEFPELSEYKSLLFEVVANEPNFTPDVYKIEWEDGQLKKHHNGNYLLELSKGKKKKNLEVFPVLESISEAEFNKKFKNYESKLTQRQTEERILKEKLEQHRKELESRMKAYQRAMDSLQLIRTAINSRNSFTSEFARVFNVTAFGTWNCDNTVPRPKGRKINLQLANLSKKLIIVPVLHLIQLGLNSTFPFNTEQQKSFQFNNKQKNLLLGITSQGDLALFRPEGFETLENLHTASLAMEIIPKDEINLEALKKQLDIN